MFSMKIRSFKFWAVVTGVLFVGWLVVSKTLSIIQPKLRSYCERLLMDDQFLNMGGQIANVEVEDVKTGPMTKRIETIGKLRARGFVEIRTEIPARVLEVVAAEGAFIEKGKDLVILDKRDTVAKLKGAKADYVYRKAEYERMSKLRAGNFESLKKLEETKSGMDRAAAQIEELEVALSKLTIVAPFDGVFGIFDVSPGAFTQQNQVIGSFVDNSFMYIDFKVPEKFVQEIGPGQVVEIKIYAFKDQIFQGTVEAIEPKSESESHSVKVKASMENYQNLLRHGLFCNVSLIIGEKQNALSVDESCVEYEGEHAFVWVVEKGRAMKRRIVTATKEKGRIEVISGLSEGDLVVIAGQLKLVPGMGVKITNLPENAAQMPSQETDAQTKAVSNNAQEKTETQTDSQSNNQKKVTYYASPETNNSQTQHVGF